jgi:hypothetical protein
MAAIRTAFALMLRALMPRFVPESPVNPIALESERLFAMRLIQKLLICLALMFFHLITGIGTYARRVQELEQQLKFQIPIFWSLS